MASKSYFQNNKVYNCFGKKKNSHKTFLAIYSHQMIVISNWKISGTTEHQAVEK